MFKLKQLRIRNLFQYKDATINFSDGLNLIIGANGSGKTNILNCIYYVLTGDFPIKKELCIRHGAEGETAFAELVLELQHENSEIRIIRNVKDKVKAYYKEQEFIGNNEVNSLLSSIGLKRNILDNCIFLKQGELRKFVDSSPRDRMFTFISILDLTRFNKLYEKISSFIKDCQIKYNRDFSKEVNEYHRLKTELDFLPPTLSFDELMSLRAKNDRLSFLQDTIKRKLNEEQKIIEALKTCNENLTKYGQQKLLCASERELDNILKYCDLLLQYRERMKQLVKNWRLRPAPSTYQEEKLVSVEKQLSVLEHQINQLRQNIYILENKKECPLCLSPITNRKVIEKLKNRFLHIQKQKQSLEQLRQKLRDAKSRYQTRATLWNAIKTLKAERNYLRSFNITIDDPKKTKEELSALRTTLKNKVNLESEKQILEAKKEQLEREISELLQEQQKLISEIPNININEQLKIYKKRQELTALLEDKAKYLELQDEAERKKKRIEILVSIKELLHYNGIPRLILDMFFQEFTFQINDLLAKLEANFHISFDLKEEINIQVIYKNGLTLSEKQLSFGERLLLALAIAISFVLLLSSVNLIILDEPTLGLDADHVNLLPQFMATLGNIQEKQIQIICATHEQRLLPIAKNLIRTESLHTSIAKDA